MSEEAVDTVLFDFSQIRQRTKVERAKLFVQRRAKGQVFVDWTELPRHPSVRCFVIHWRSLNDNQVKQACCCFPLQRTALLDL